MIVLANRAEKKCIDALLADKKIQAIYGAGKIFQGYVAANILSSLNEYIYLKRISAVTLDRNLSGESDNLRRVRLQVDVSDVSYTNMISRSEQVKEVLKTAFPSCIDDDAYGTVTAGQKVLNVASIDIILVEQAEE